MRGAYCAAIVAIERGKPAIAADRDFARVCAPCAIEARRARAGCGRSRRCWRGAARTGVAGACRLRLSRARRSFVAGAAVAAGGCSTRASVASGAMIASALRRRTTRAAAVRRLLDACSRRPTVSVRRPPTTATPGGRSSDSEPEQLTAPVVLSSLSITGFSIRTTAYGGELVERRLVAPAQLRRAAEQLALDEVVGRAARAELLADSAAARGRDFGVGQLVLVGASARREIGDDQHQQDKPADSAIDRPVESCARASDASSPLRLHSFKPALVQPHDAVHLGREPLVVGRDQRRAALAAHQVEELGEDGVGGMLVEVAGGLVGEDQRRLVGERAGDRDALLLAARELRRPMVEPLGKAERAEQLPARARVRRLGLGAADELRQDDILDAR